jgi:hypothetical protein
VDLLWFSSGMSLVSLWSSVLVTEGAGVHAHCCTRYGDSIGCVLLLTASASLVHHWAITLGSSASSGPCW